MSSTVSHILLSLGVCGFPGATWPDRNLYAWQDPHTEDFPHSDLQGSLVAEDSWEHCHGSLSGRCFLPCYGLAFHFYYRLCFPSMMTPVFVSRCLTRSWMLLRLRRCRRRQSTPGSHTRWTHLARTFSSLHHTSGMSLGHRCLPTQSMTWNLYFHVQNKISVSILSLHCVLSRLEQVLNIIMEALNLVPVNVKCLPSLIGMWWTAPPHRNTGSTFSCAGVTMIHMTLSAMPGPSSLTTLQTTWVSTHPPPGC